ncbi:MAG: RagB/SusD family nutrient uptake outer membrane protein [Paludibacter sp.]|jgi:hypothetical protein|nr:RagB/SusD family nutrient uptake outer membrane protein [Paludibacter sp.]
MKNTIYSLAIFIAAIFTFASCVDTIPEEVVESKNVYTDVGSADKAIIGLYGQFMQLADRVIVLNELRADLMDVTTNADADLQEISISKPSKNNAWADANPFYKVIQTCNDIMYNFDLMLADNRLLQQEYAERYSDVAAIRTWIYLQLGIHFESVLYITEPIVSKADIEKNNNYLNLDALLPELIRCMEGLPTLENYKSTPITGTLDGYNLTQSYIDKRLVLADLYLFNNQYEQAAQLYRTVMSAGEDKVAGNNDADRKYRLCTEESWTFGTTAWSYGILNDRYKPEDISSMHNAWREMFGGVLGQARASWEHIWFFNYDKKFEPAYTLRKLFDPTSKNGNYKLRPSDYSVEDIWGAETQKNGFNFDARGLTGGIAQQGNDYYIKKYSYFDEYPNADTKGGWWLYRAGMLHLRYAEAVNRAGYPKLAWAIVNDGLFGVTFDFKRADGTAYPGDSVKVTGYSPFEPYPAPYNFDARYADIGALRLRGAWRNNRGVRGRANLPNVNFPTEATTKQDSILFLERFIIAEAARELGFEGHRWEDLLREARRLNQELAGAGNRFLWDENIKKKFDRSGVSGADLSTSDKWFLKIN